MENNKIIVHQAFYGEVNRAHSCIQQTLIDENITSFLTSFTDRPAALPTGSDLLPYLSGSSYLSKYYFFTKTFSDNTASRAGMVFSHVLILDLSDIEKLDNLDDIFKYFLETIPEKNEKLDPLEITLYYNHIKKIKQPLYIQQVISSYIAGNKPILFSGSIISFIRALQVIWDSPENEQRKNIKFRTSFTPSDIQSTTHLTIVSIQNEFLSKWQGIEIINDNFSDLIEITEPSELLFLGIKEGNLFYDFLISLRVDLKQIRNFRQYGNLFEDYKNIDSIENADQIRQDIRLLSKISPVSQDGILIKNKFIARLEYLIESKKDSNIKALKNIEWSAFHEGVDKATNIVSQFITTEITNLKDGRVKHFSEIIEVSINDIPENWWHSTIITLINSEFQKGVESSQLSFWKLFKYSIDTLKNLFLIIVPNDNSESTLLKYFPEELNKSICEEIILISQRNNWYLLNAHLLLNNYSLEESIDKQLLFEKKLTLKDSVGVQFIAEKLSKKQLIDLSLKSNDDKLVSLSIDAIITDSNLFQTFDSEDSVWFRIWEGVVIKTKNLFVGLSNREEEITFAVLDRLISRKKVDIKIIELISDSKYSDISNYVNRISIWDKIPYSHKNKFIVSTTNNLVNQFINDKIDKESLELEIKNWIISDSFMTDFLNKNRNDIEPVLKIYEQFENLKDSFLSDYIRYYSANISENLSIRLGKLVLNRKFKNSAKQISEKAKYQNSFKPANRESESLIEVINPLKSIISALFGNSSYSENYKPNQTMNNINTQSLPTIVILTAIKEEYNAVREHLINIYDADQNDTSYEAGIFKYKDREIAQIIIRECGPKNTTASQETERAIQYFNPKAMFFVGIAGSRKPNDFSVGDVIFPEKVYSYEGGKSEKESFVARPDIGSVTYTLIEKAKKERSKNDWKELIKGDWNTDPVKADLGVIASGEQVVEHYNSEIGNVLLKHYNDTSAIEMEGFGFAKATNKQGRQTRNMEVGIIRGISDIIEQPNTKENIHKDDNRPADAKKFASATAAAFTYWLILKTYS